MYILEIVIVFLILLLLYSTGWLVRIIQLLVARFLDFGRALIESIIREQIEKPEVKKKPKRS
ncbi:MAG: hypothetical protein JSV74_01525 [Dehalococcoidia bacterium]|nr:MAG: hypothetical protein JSV74_01525 [Dehalococcoidia bacterium]